MDAARTESAATGRESQEPPAEATDELPDKVRRDLKADEADPSHVVPSAEGHVAFAGLSEDVRGWVRKQLDDLRKRTNGAGRAQKHTNGGDGVAGTDADRD